MSSEVKVMIKNCVFHLVFTFSTYWSVVIVVIVLLLLDRKAFYQVDRENIYGLHFELCCISFRSRIMKVRKNTREQYFCHWWCHGEKDLTSKKICVNIASANNNCCGDNLTTYGGCFNCCFNCSYCNNWHCHITILVCYINKKMFRQQSHFLRDEMWNIRGTSRVVSNQSRYL